MSQPFDPSKLLASATTAAGVHIDPIDVLDGLEWEQAGVIKSDFPHSIFQIVNHLIYWQDLFLSGLVETTMHGPQRASDSWPGEKRAGDKEEWQAAVKRFKEGLEKARFEIGSKDPLSGIPAAETTLRIDILNSLALHVSYHVGQIVLIRRVLRAWPPPNGGHTW